MVGLTHFYFFVNRQLFREEDTLPEQVLTAQLWLIQAKYESGFGETPITKMQSFVDDLMTFSRSLTSMTYYSQKVRDLIRMFRDAYQIIMAQPHDFQLSFVYATRSDQPPHPDVLTRVDSLEACARRHVSSITTDFQFWGAARLFEAFRMPQNKTLRLDVLPSILMDKGSVVCLAGLESMYRFLTDDQGGMRQYLLEPNVRDYQGLQNPVNKAIRDTLQAQQDREFWWLNNGITILADRCTVGGDGVTIEGAEIVNGLQTCHEIYNYFKSGTRTDHRSVMVRVIQTSEEEARNEITKATNNQTPVNPLSLRATEPLHFEIEDRLKLYDLYYDRKKGKYRRLKKPVSKIISLRELGQAVMAVAIQAPDDARARPMSVLKGDGYKKVFDTAASRNVFVASILLDRQVVAFLTTRDELTADARTDLRYYVSTWLGAVLAGKPSPSTSDIANIVEAVNSPLPDTLFSEALREITQIYDEQGGDDRAAKGPHMKRKVLERLRSKFDGDGTGNLPAEGSAGTL